MVQKLHSHSKHQHIRTFRIICLYRHSLRSCIHSFSIKLKLCTVTSHSKWNEFFAVLGIIPLNSMDVSVSFFLVILNRRKLMIQHENSFRLKFQRIFMKKSSWFGMIDKYWLNKLDIVYMYAYAVLYSLFWYNFYILFAFCLINREEIEEKIIHDSI